MHYQNIVKVFTHVEKYQKTCAADNKLLQSRFLCKYVFCPPTALGLGQSLETTADLMRLRIHARTHSRTHTIMSAAQHTLVKRAVHPLGRAKKMLMYE